LEVLRLVPVLVKEVRVVASTACSTEAPPEASKAAPVERVSLSVRQSERHSIFVASGPGMSGGVAVASASVDVQATSQWLRVKNTFIVGEEDLAEEDGPPMRRAGSAPARMRKAGRSRGDEDRLSTSSVKTFASSFVSSACTPALGFQPRIVIGGENPDRQGMDPEEEYKQRETTQVVSVSLALQAKRAGLKSIGGLRHADGSCCMCLMESWHQAGKADREPCKWGLMCGRCHEEHDPQEVAAFRRQRRRDARRLRAVSGA